MRKIKKQKKVQIRGVTTVEMAYIMPVVLLVFLAIIYVTFYFHDKNILGAVAYETAVIGAQQERLPRGMQEGELSGFFQEHITGKLILLSNPTASVSKNSDYIIVETTASRRNMKLHMEMKTWIMEPEKMIRMIRKVKK